MTDDSTTNGHPTSNGKAPKQAAQDAARTAQAPGLPQLPDDWHATPELRPVLINRDISKLYQWLNAAGVPQRQIAQCTGQSQSEVCEIFNGRRVIAYDVFVRVCVGLHVPRERMGLSYWGPNGAWCGPEQSYPGGVTVPQPPKGVSADMLRRHLIALGGRLAAILAGVPIAQAVELKIGEPLNELGPLPTVALPFRLSVADVTRVQDMTRRLGVGDTCCADAAMAAATAALATQLLDVPGPDPVRQALQVAVGELRIEAGWAAFDAGLYHHALYHYTRAFELATQAGDPYLQALALGYAGLANAEHGHPDDGLKLLQTAQVTSWSIPPDDQRAVVVGEVGRNAVEAQILANQASALALLDQHAEAARMVAKGRDLWTPTPADAFGDPDRAAARVELDRGRLDVAHTLATASLRRWKGGRQKSRTMTGTVLATIHVTAGDSAGLQLAHDSITAVGRLTSIRNRKQLLPLAEALDARPGADARELAQMARQIAA